MCMKNSKTTEDVVEYLIGKEEITGIGIGSKKNGIDQWLFLEQVKKHNMEL